MGGAQWLLWPSPPRPSECMSRAPALGHPSVTLQRPGGHWKPNETSRAGSGTIYPPFLGGHSCSIRMSNIVLGDKHIPNVFFDFDLSAPPPPHTHTWGAVFVQRAHSANYYGDYPGNNPENHPHCGIMHNQFKTQKFKHLMLAMGPRDLNSAPYSPVHCSSHSMTSFQSSELTELLVVENSQLFAQRAHSARYATWVPLFKGGGWV